MSAKYEELVKAGAPRLPEGYYYKITMDEIYRRKGVIVSLYRKCRWLPDERLAKKEEWASTVGSIKELANMCAITHEKVFPEPTERTWHADFIGRHP